MITRKLFKKAPLRRQKLLLEVSMPPEPVLTGWGLWLTCNFVLHRVFRSFATLRDRNEDDAVPIKELRKCLENEDLKLELVDHIYSTNTEHIAQVKLIYKL